ncbi:histamine H1 receptor-like [Ptychodera flava]|uniref:histamine H1 receptor-like n=1 Tax=Ptychodera flava TaxID=63121 RepID=UPI00396A198E
MEKTRFVATTIEQVMGSNAGNLTTHPTSTINASILAGAHVNASGDDEIIDAFDGEISSDIPIGIVLSLMSLMTTIGNAMVLHAVKTEKRLQTVSNYFILSLACADMLIGMIVMPLSCAYILSHHWPLGLAVCQIWLSIDYVCCTASILNLFVLSLDRYWSITSPLKYLRRRTGKRAAILISLVWLVSSLWVIPVVGWHEFSHGGNRLVQPGHCDTEFHTNTVFKVVTAAFNFYIPMIVMVFLYGRIFHEIRKRSNLSIGRCTYGHGGTTTSDEATYAYTAKKSSNDHDYHTEYEFDSSNSNERDSEANRSRISDDRANFTNVALLRRLKNIIRTDKNNQTSSTSSMPLHSREHISTVTPHETLLQSETCVEDDSLRFDFGHSNSNSPNGRISILRPPSNSNERKISFVSTPIPRKEPAPEVIWRRRSEEELKPPLLHHGKPNHKERNNSHDATRSPYLSIAGNSTAKTKKVDVRSGIVPKSAKKNTFKLGKLEHLIKPPRKKRFSASLNRERKAAKQLGVIMGCFILCWLPYFIMFLIVTLCKDCVSENVYAVAIWLGYINSTLNPILYPLCNQNFRRAFRKMLHLQPSKKK